MFTLYASRIAKQVKLLHCSDMFIFISVLHYIGDLYINCFLLQNDGCYADSELVVYECVLHNTVTIIKQASTAIMLKKLGAYGYCPLYKILFL